MESANALLDTLRQLQVLLNDLVYTPARLQTTDVAVSLAEFIDDLW